MFESTLPLGEPELMRVSAFQRYLTELKREGADESLTRLSSLNPSLLQDLLRFEQDGRHTELLEVLAACVRHARPLAVHLQCGMRVVPLTVFPQNGWRIARCRCMSSWPSGCPTSRCCTSSRPCCARPATPRPRWSASLHLYQPLGPVRGSWRCAARASSCCPRSPARPPTAWRLGIEPARGWR